MIILIKRDSEIFLTQDSLLAEEDVDNSNVLLPGVVDVLLTKRGEMESWIS